MALARWQATIVNAAGDVLPGASIEVRRESVGQPLVSLYSDRDGASPISNAFTSDADGFAAFHAAGGVYKIVASKGGFSRTWRYVGIGTASENDAESFVAVDGNGDVGIGRDLTVGRDIAVAGDAAIAGDLALVGMAELDEMAAPSNPAANKLRVYAKDVGGVTKLHTLDSAGTETAMGTGGREVLAADRTYYVRSDGSDSNTGLVNNAGGAFLTLQKAVDVTAALDLSIYNVTINWGAATITSTLTLKDPLGAGRVTISGAGATSLISTTSASAVVYTGTFKYTLTNMKVQTTTSGRGVQGFGPSSLIIGAGFEYGACATYHAEANVGAILTHNASYTISGNAPVHMIADNGGMIVAAGITVTLTGTPAFSNVFAFADNASLIRVNANTYSGSATGSRFLVRSCSVIYTNGGGASYLPGNSGGTGTNPSASPYGLYV